MNTVTDILLAAEQALLAASPTANTDARVLLAYCLGKDQVWLITHKNEKVTPSQLGRYRELLQRRRQHEPIAYITGHKEFWSLDIHVTPNVLIPRPETELLVERALQHIPNGEIKIADIATGSGVVALAIASERPNCSVIATDISQTALDIAKHNAYRLKINNVNFRLGSWVEPLRDDYFDVIVCNPPYVADADPHLFRGDVSYEPSLALTAGTDGLDAIRVIVSKAKQHLSPMGWLILEHGYDQQPTINAMLEYIGYKNVLGFSDYAGHPRVIEGQTAT